MPKRMLINATQPEELRVALVDGQWLFDLDIENPGREQKKGNIYKARIIRYEPSLEALFVYYGSDRHGFLPIREIAREYFIDSGIEELNRSNVKEVLPEGKELLVQIDKEERGSKGAALTTFISLAGCYLVLMPNNPRAGGISRRVEGDERAELREILSALAVPEDMGLIIRTAGVGRQLEELQWDLGVLLSQWKAIQEAAISRSAPALIHQEGNVVTRAIRDYLRPDIDEVIIDHRKIHDDVRSYIQMVRPDFLDRIKLYEDSIPLFNRYQIESQIESAFRRQVQLPSGGALVIDHTEALVSIDINSARATRGGDIEETALHTNLEAADEIARQCRLRDLGGLIVIDFIDMMSARNQKMVENRLREAVEKDRARIQIGRISRFGLLEMSRQRLRPVLGESSRIPCPTCDGQGSVRSVDSQALIVLRVIEEEAIKENTAEIHVELSLDVATYLMNEKRKAIFNLEGRHNIRIIVIPNSVFAIPQYHVKRIRVDEVASGRYQEAVSYSLVSKTEKTVENLLPKPVTPEQPAVKHILSAPAPAPITTPRSEAPSLIKRLWGSLFGPVENEATSRIPASAEQPAVENSPHRRHAGGQGGWSRPPRGGQAQGKRRGSQGFARGREGRETRPGREQPHAHSRDAATETHEHREHREHRGPREHQHEHREHREHHEQRESRERTPRDRAPREERGQHREHRGPRGHQHEHREHRGPHEHRGPREHREHQQGHREPHEHRGTREHREHQHEPREHRGSHEHREHQHELREPQGTHEHREHQHEHREHRRPHEHREHRRPREHREHQHEHREHQGPHDHREHQHEHREHQGPHDHREHQHEHREPHEHQEHRETEVKDLSTFHEPQERHVQQESQVNQNQETREHRQPQEQREEPTGHRDHREGTQHQHREQYEGGGGRHEGGRRRSHYHGHHRRRYNDRDQGYSNRKEGKDPNVDNPSPVSNDSHHSTQAAPIERESIEGNRFEDNRQDHNDHQGNRNENPIVIIPTDEQNH